MLTLLAKTDGSRDLSLSEIAREAAITAITTGSPAFESSGPAAAAVALRAVLPEVELLQMGNALCLQSGSTASPQFGANAGIWSFE